MSTLGICLLVATGLAIAYLAVVAIFFLPPILCELKEREKRQKEKGLEEDDKKRVVLKAMLFCLICPAVTGFCIVVGMIEAICGESTERVLRSNNLSPRH